MKLASTATMDVTRRVLPESIGWSCGLSGLGRYRGFGLSQKFLHALLEVTLVLVLPPAKVRHDLHLTAFTLRYQGDVVGSLEDRPGNIDMNRVLHIVGSRHLCVVTLRDGVVLGIAKGVFDRAPHLAAWNGIGALVGLSECRQSKSKRHQSQKQKSRLRHGTSPRTNVVLRVRTEQESPFARRLKNSPFESFVQCARSPYQNEDTADKQSNVVARVCFHRQKCNSIVFALLFQSCARLVVHCLSESLFTTQIFLGRLHRNVPE